MSIAQQLNQIIKNLPEHITLVAISKTQPNEAIREAFEVGQIDFGENRVQELTAKAQSLPAEIRWHLVGHLQTNKVKYIVPFVHMIHSVDSLKLLEEIQRQSQKIDRKVNVLLQVRIASEESKFGIEPDKLISIGETIMNNSLSHVCIRGLMGMGTLTDDQYKLRKEFNQLRKLFEKLCTYPEMPGWQLDTLSMGMSSDYQIAVECGSTMVRLGSAIFGSR